MKLRIDLFVRAHRSGFFTLFPLGDRTIQVYTDDLDSAREDLTLLLSDRVERTHPRAQSDMSPPFEMRHETLALEDALIVHTTEDVGRQPTDVSMLVGERRGWRSLFFPRFDLFYWVPKKVDYRDAAKTLLREFLDDQSEGGRLAHRYDEKEWVEVLEIEAEPPSLSAFSGKLRDAKMLPLRIEEEEKKKAEEEAKDDKKKKKKPTPTLEKIGVPLSRLAEEGDLDRAFERKKELEDLTALLAGRQHKCIAIVGKRGVGKSTILTELVHAIEERPVWFADASRLVATDGWFGDWQRQVFDVVAECEEANVVWFIGAALPLLDAGKHIGSDQNVSQLLKPFLAGRRITVVAEATDAEWSRLELRDAGFARLFSTYRIEEPREDEAQRILSSIVKSIEEVESVRITPAALQTADALCRRYHSTGSALGTSAAFLRRFAEYAAANDLVDADRAAVVSCFSSETGLPERLVRDDLPLDPAEVRAAFEARLVGQHRAVSRMVDLVLVIKAGMSDLSKPLGSFLFVGPTGVGKTETAKALASFLFGSEERLARFDMSEYMGPDAVNRFLGDADNEGKLVETVRRRPFSVVLLDEIEKANPAVFDVLLQVLGEARLTDEAGRVADFKNAVVVMTSNLGVETLSRKVGFDSTSATDEIEAHFVKEAERFFRPEMFNRIDHIVPFLPLEAEAIRRITDHQLGRLMRREGIRQRGLAFELGGDVPDWLAERGVDPRYGARPLKRAIERSLTIPLARHLSRRRSDPGVRATVDGEMLAFERREATEREAGEARAKQVLRGLLEEVDRLGFRCSRWMSGRDYFELDSEVRLYEQLSKMQRFWDAKALAERRSRGMDKKRALLDAFIGVRDTIRSLEDVAFDEYSRRSLGLVETIENDLASATSELAKAELDLYAMRYSNPDVALLYIVPGQNAEVLHRELIECYVRIADELGYDVQLFAAKRIEDKSQDDKKKDDPDKKAPKKPKRVRARWRWVARGSWAPAEQDEDEDSVRVWRRKQLRDFPEEFVSALSITGPRAACYFAHESGRHLRIGGSEQSMVRVTFQNRRASHAGVLTHPADLPQSMSLVRTQRVNARVVDDHVLDSHQAEAARLSKVYLRFMRERLVLDALGSDATAWAKLWGAT